MSPCPACRCEDAGEQLTVRELMFGTGESFPYAACPDCGSVRLAAVPEDLGRYYPEDYYSVDLDPERIFAGRHVRAFTRLVTRSVLFGSGRLTRAARKVVRRRQFQTLTSILGAVRAAGLPRGRQTRVLDVGCGSGVLIHVLALAGLTSVTGVDPFAPADRVLGSGAVILKRELEEVQEPFDLVMFHHSFEHVLDPGASLDAAAGLLTPGGRVLVRMPTVTSDAFERYREDWVQLDAPRHITVFSREGMARLCAERGLELVATHDDSTAFQFWGSEQARAGVALGDPESHFVNPAASRFTDAQIGAWDREAEGLNAIGRGDQSAWVLRVTAQGSVRPA